MKKNTQIPWEKRGYFLIFFLLLPISFISSDELLRAEILFSEGHFFEALPIYQKKFKNNGHNFEKREAYCLAATKKFEKALSILNFDSEDEEQKLFIAFCLRNIKKEKKALEILKNYDGKQKERAILESALCHIGLGNHSQAITALSSLRSIEAKILQAYLLIDEKNFSEAKKVLESLPETSNVDGLKGILALTQNSLESAKNHLEKAPKSSFFSQKLLRVYLKLALQESCRTLRKNYLEKSILLAQSHLKENPFQKAFIHLLQSKYLNDPKALEKAEDLLKNIPKENLLMYAEIAATEEEKNQRKQLYISDPILLGKSLYLQGIDSHQLSKENQEHAKWHLDAAIASFSQAFELFKDKETTFCLLSLGALAEALTEHPNHAGKLQAFFLLEAFLQQDQKEIHNHPLISPLILQYGKIAFATSKMTGSDALLIKAKHSLKDRIQLYPKLPESLIMTTLLAKEALDKNEYQEALTLFSSLSSQEIGEPLEAEALFWEACCLEKIGGDPNQVRSLRQLLVTKFPNSSFAAEALFRSYSLGDYLQGEKLALKSLMQFPSLYPKSPYAIIAWFLIGLDSKRDRKTAEGKWLKKKNFSSAIDAFQKAETTFVNLQKEQLIEEKLLPKLIQVKYRASLERGLANLAIAKESQGAKRRIYLTYAENVFKKIHEDHLKDPLIMHYQLDPFPAVLQESQLALSQAFALQGRDAEKKEALFSLIDACKKNAFTENYFLSKAYIELAKHSLEEKNSSAAIEFFSLAEKAAGVRPELKGILSAEQWLDLWIQKSMAFQMEGNWKKAMHLLSKAINQDVASILRLKAMFLRAELLASLGKEELAKKQLIALSTKGSIWGEKAQKKLKEIYGD